MHFSMRWRFRLDQSRTIFSLITFALILAQSYVKYLLLNMEPDDIPL